MKVLNYGCFIYGSAERIVENGCSAELFNEVRILIKPVPTAVELTPTILSGF